MAIRHSGIVWLAAAALVVAASTLAPAASVNIDQWAGVYKTRHMNGDSSGDKYTTEDILEIVKVSPTAAYIRTHLFFFNGHECGIAGIARLEGDALVYRGETDVDKKQCLLRLKASRGKLTFEDDNSACRNTTCGARGGYSGPGFELKRRRPIRYMKLILKSDEYKAAVEELKEQKTR